MKYNSWVASDKKFLNSNLFILSISLFTIKGIWISFWTFYEKAKWLQFPNVK